VQGLVCKGVQVVLPGKCVHSTTTFATVFPAPLAPVVWSFVSWWVGMLVACLVGWEVGKINGWAGRLVRPQRNDGNHFQLPRMLRSLHALYVTSIGGAMSTFNLLVAETQVLVSCHSTELWFQLAEDGLHNAAMGGAMAYSTQPVGCERVCYVNGAH
jgi:hypothetical protein